MRMLTILLIALSCLWGGYWVVGARALDRGVTAWLDALPTKGWRAGYSDLAVQGFPNRFDLTITDPHLADPVTGVGWDAPFVQALALSYKPYHIIVVLPQTQTLSLPHDRVTVTGDTLRASAEFRPIAALPLEKLVLALDRIRVSGTGWGFGFETGRFAIQQADPNGTVQHLGAEVTALRPDPDLRARLDPGSSLPDAVATLHLDATATLDAPLDRTAIETKALRITAVSLKQLRLVWGPLSLEAAGTLRVGANGLPEGQILLKAAGWQQMLTLAAEAGWLDPVLIPAIAGGLAVLAAASPDPAELEVPLGFADGLVSLGPIPLGPAPSLRFE